MSSDGTLTNLYSFTGGGEGAGPNWLVQGSDGNFYGTTPFDGISGNGGPATGNGIVFRISVSSNLPSILTSDGSLGIINNQFGFTIAGASGSVVVVQASTNLANPGWVPVSTNTVVGGTSFFSDPQWTNYPSRFYRLQAY
jgi:hypothetical protein